jgi:hypothetical protein
VTFYSVDESGSFAQRGFHATPNVLSITCSGTAEQYNYGMLTADKFVRITRSPDSSDYYDKSLAGSKGTGLSLSQDGDKILLVNNG